MGKKIRFGIVGAGHIGLRHAAMIAANPATEVAAFADIDPGALAEAGKAFPGAGCYDTMEEMLGRAGGLDVVCICTPNGLHAGQSISALEKGCHVVCEKPMGLTRASCEEVIHKAFQVHKHVFCVMQNRYSPPAEWLKEMVTGKKLGKIFMVQISCYWNRDERYYAGSPWKGTLELDGGPLFTQFSHFIDIMYWLFGDIRNVRSSFGNFNHSQITEFEDSGFITFEFNNGALGAFSYSTSVYDRNFESSITIIGEKGTVKVGGQYMDKVEYCHVRDYSMPELKPSSPPNDYGLYKGSAANHHFIIDNVVATLTGNSSATTNALEGMKVVEIIERIYESRKAAASGKVLQEDSQEYSKHKR